MNDSSAEADFGRRYSTTGRSDSMEPKRFIQELGRGFDGDERESPEVIKLMARHAPLSV